MNRQCKIRLSKWYTPCPQKERERISREIGQYKKEHSMPILQAKRYDEILNKRGAQAVELGINPEFVKTLLQAIHEESVHEQVKVING